MQIILNLTDSHQYFACAPGETSKSILLANPIITINGNTATAHLIWTGVMNEGIGKLPQIFEQGREDTELGQPKR
jgi:hypothetical protein